jgi:hypothetical protein
MPSFSAAARVPAMRLQQVAGRRQIPSAAPVTGTLLGRLLLRDARSLRTDELG